MGRKDAFLYALMQSLADADPTRYGDLVGTARQPHVLETEDGDLTFIVFPTSPLGGPAALNVSWDSPPVFAEVAMCGARGSMQVNWIPLPLVEDEVATHDRDVRERGGASPAPAFMAEAQAGVMGRATLEPQTSLEDLGWSAR